MTTQYTSTLKLALPVTGELSGSWGDVVNDNITSMIEQAIAGLSTINTWTANAHTLTTANGVSSESRCAMLVAATGGGAPTAAASIICPDAAKLYVLQNNTSFTVTLKTSAGTGVAVAAGDIAFLFCDGTNVNSCVTTIVNGHITGNLTVDGNTTLGNAAADTITMNGQFVTGTQLKSAQTATNTLSLAAYDTDGVAYTNLVTLTASTTPTLALTSTGVGTINNMSIGATTLSTGAFTTLASNGATTFTAGTASTTTATGTLVITGGLGVSGRINAANFDGIVGANTAAAGTFTTLDSSGNTTLGNAATDTVTVNGFMGVGVAASGDTALLVGSPTLTGTAQRGIDAATTFGTGATTAAQQVRVISTLTTAGTYAQWIGVNVAQPQGSGYTLTDAHGLYIQNQTKGTNNYGITSEVSSGTNKFNIYASGTAQNYFAGNLLVGATSARASAGVTAALQVESTTVNGGSQFLTVNNATAGNGPLFSFNRSRGTALGDVTVVAQGDTLGRVFFAGADGTNLIAAASISSQVDATPGTNDMPGRLIFSTTADGASTVTERMRIDSAGNVGIGSTSPVTKLEVAGSNNSTWSATLTSISSTTMTIAGTVTGTIAIGDIVYGTGVQPYTRITAGSALSWTVSVSQTVASATLVGGATYSNTLIRITDTDTGQDIGQPTGGLQFFTSDSNAPTAGVGAYVAALAESTTPDTALVFGTRDNGGGGVDANERMRISSAGNVGIGTVTPDANLTVNGAASFAAGTALLPSIARAGDLNTGIWFPAADTIAFTEGGVESMRIDSSGNVLVGTTSNASTQGSPLQVITAIAARRNIASAGGPAFRMEKSRATTDGTYTIVADTDTLGDYQFFGADGVQYIIGASVKAVVNGTPGVNDMPTALTFSTTADGASAVTERMRIDSAGNVGIGTTSPTAVLMLKAGTATASTSPLKFTSGTNLTSAEAGSVEYDGNVFYGTADVTSGRGLWPTTQYFRLTADGTAIGPTIANFFGATSGKSLDTSAFYEVEYNLYFTKTTAGTVTFTLTYANAPINCDANYVGTPVGGVGTVGAPQTAALVKSTATASALPVTGSLTTAVNHQYTVKAIFQANATTGGTLNLQVTSSAGTVTPLTGSYYKVTRLPAANTGAFS